MLTAMSVKYPRFGFTKVFTPEVREEVEALIEEFLLVPEVLTQSPTLMRAVHAELYSAMHQTTDFQREMAQEFMRSFVDNARKRRYKKLDSPINPQLRINFE